jgi:hypothetical protein
MLDLTKPKIKDYYKLYSSKVIKNQKDRWKISKQRCKNVGGQVRNSKYSKETNILQLEIS